MDLVSLRPNYAIKNFAINSLKISEKNATPEM